VETDVHAEDGGYGGLHGLVHVAGVERGPQPLLRLPRLHEDDAHRAHVGRGRPHLRQVVDLTQQGVAYRPVLPGVVRPGFTEKQVQTFTTQHAPHAHRLASLSWERSLTWSRTLSSAPFRPSGRS